jgi:metal-dependent amidase/aminoacylase/carboxypeptidase family protein
MGDVDKTERDGKIDAYLIKLTEIRRDIHQHPETTYEENRTADIVAENLKAWGLDVSRGLGKTGVVGTLCRGGSNRAIGLRADMDALFIHKVNYFKFCFVNKGKIPVCGHDDHTTMLLGANKYLSTAPFIFYFNQPRKAGLVRKR